MGQPAGAATPAPYPNVQSDPHAADRVLGEQLVLDRKSTRLNSSHSQISYAVFCLKKKNYMSVHIVKPALIFVQRIQGKDKTFHTPSCRSLDRSHGPARLAFSHLVRWRAPAVFVWL